MTNIIKTALECRNPDDDNEHGLLEGGDDGDEDGFDEDDEDDDEEGEMVV